jgi:hypothetical protein
MYNNKYTNAIYCLPKEHLFYTLEKFHFINDLLTKN